MSAHSVLYRSGKIGLAQNQQVELQSGNCAEYPASEKLASEGFGIVDDAN